MITVKIDNSLFTDDLLNFSEIKLEYNRTEKTIRVPSLKLKGDARDKILQVISSKKTLSKVPISILIDNDEVFFGYLDFTQDHNLSCEDFFIGIHADKVDVLRDLAQGFTIEMLNPEVKKVPTVVARVPQYTEAALALGITFLLTLALREQIQKLIEEVSGLAGNPLEWGRIAVLITRVAYIAVILGSIIVVLKRFYDLLIGDVIEYGAFSVEDTLKKGAQRLGLNFYTDVPFLRELYVMPAQSEYAKTDYEQLTFGDFLQRMADLMSCVTFVKNNTLYFVRKLPPVECYHLIEKTSEPFEIKLNSSDILVREELKLAHDSSDANTLLLKNYYIQLIRSELKTQNERVIYSSYALGRRKDKLTLPEEILKDALVVFETLLNGIITVINGIIAVVNAIIRIIKGIIKALRALGIKIKSNLKTITPIPKQNFSAKIEERKGALLLGNGVVGTPRILTLSGNKLAQKQYGAEDFFDKFETRDKEGQKKLYSIFTPLCKSDINKLIKCNGVKINGKNYLLEALEYNYAEEVAKITFSERFIYANFTEKISKV